MALAIKIGAISLFCFFAILAPVQDQKKADSLKKVYHNNSSSEEELEMLLQIAEVEPNPDIILEYTDILLEKAKEASDVEMIHNALLQKGTALRLKGDYDLALQALLKSIDYAQKAELENGVAKAHVEIGNVYSLMNNTANAELYYDRGIDFFRKSRDSLSLGKTLFNAGDEYLRLKEAEKAEALLEEAEQIFRDQNVPLALAYTLGNLGRVYALQGKDEAAEKYLDEAVQRLEVFGDHNAIAEYLRYMAISYADKGDEKAAIRYGTRSLELSKEFGLKEHIANAHLALSRAFEKNGDLENSLAHYKEYIIYQDSIRNIESVMKMANMRTNFEIRQKQAEVDLLNEQKNNQKIIVIATVIALILILLLALGLYRRNKFIGKTKAIIEREKNRSEILLLNILPAQTAAELKEDGKVKAKRFDAVTVLFTDFRNFTHYAENLSPEELVKSVDFYFSNFDKIIEKHGLEKIKTVGDAYMCASGVPFPVEDHAARIVTAAKEMMDFVEQAKTIDSEMETRFDMRIGINSGPVVAGVVGLRKFAYDIWGDTVNIASRMESCSEAGKINISENTYNLVQNSFCCDYRGEIQVKNKGMMKMYFVNGPIASKA